LVVCKQLESLHRTRGYAATFAEAVAMAGAMMKIAPVEANAVEAVIAFDEAVHLPCDVCGGALPADGDCGCEAAHEVAYEPVPEMVLVRACPTCGDVHTQECDCCDVCEAYHAESRTGTGVPSDVLIRWLFDKTNNRDQPFVVNGIKMTLRLSNCGGFTVLWDGSLSYSYIYEKQFCDHKFEARYAKIWHYCNSLAECLVWIADCITAETDRHAAKLRAFQRGDVLYAHGVVFWWSFEQQAVLYFQDRQSMSLRLSSPSTDGLRLTVTIFGQPQTITVKWADVTLERPA
jgi:hypothetical protein